jgi:hypothetical protein
VREVAVRTKDQWGTVGCFESSRPSTVVDLSKLPSVPSMFDANRAHERRPLVFLHKFVGQLSKPRSCGVRADPSTCCESSPRTIHSSGFYIVPLSLVRPLPSWTYRTTIASTSGQAGGTTGPSDLGWCRDQ